MTIITNAATTIAVIITIIGAYFKFDLVLISP